MEPFFALSGYAKKGDVRGFLREYLRLIMDGKVHHIPATMDKEAAKSGWADILSEKVKEFSGHFLEKISQEWVTLVTNQGGVTDEHFVAKIVEKLYRTNPEPVLKVSPLSQDIQRDESEETAGSIFKKVKQMIDEENSDLFLVYYLSYIQLGIVPVLPLSTVHHLIEVKWEEIIGREFGVTPSSVFLLKLTSRWFYVMNLKGIPTTPDQLAYLYQEEHTYVQGLRPKNPSKPIEKRTFWRWFFKP